MRFLSREMIAIPNARSLHDVPTSKGGGLAIVVSWYIGITWLYFFEFLETDLYLALLSGIFIAAISLIDDFYGVKPAIRLFVHLITAIIAFWLIGGLRPLIIPQIHFGYNFIVYPIAITGIVWFINLFNFMDGADGLASVEAIFISAVLFVMTWNLSAILLIFCVGGFLCWNWPKARIFMGDTGSTQLGFILVILGIYSHNNFDFSILNWIMLSSPFWFDATLTLLRRWRNGEKLSEGHRKHVYQRLVRMGYSHARVNHFLIMVNISIVILITIYREIKFLQIPLFILTLILYYLITLWVDKRIPFKD
jgi:UDP-N-acetylmuramyl pentapeptide phosphotransferase/UDP-N-acetylglucosamine-1-phosphate transferase